jgi:hypothetical protein
MQISMPLYRPVSWTEPTAEERAEFERETAARQAAYRTQRVSELRGEDLELWWVVDRTAPREDRSRWISSPGIRLSDGDVEVTFARAVSDDPLALARRELQERLPGRVGGDGWESRTSGDRAEAAAPRTIDVVVAAETLTFDLVAAADRWSAVGAIGARAQLLVSGTGRAPTELSVRRLDVEELAF